MERTPIDEPAQRVFPAPAAHQTGLHQPRADPIAGHDDLRRREGLLGHRSPRRTPHSTNDRTTRCTARVSVLRSPQDSAMRRTIRSTGVDHQARGPGAGMRHELRHAPDVRGVAAGSFRRPPRRGTGLRLPRTRFHADGSRSVPSMLVAKYNGGRPRETGLSGHHGQRGDPGEQALLPEPQTPAAVARATREPPPTGRAPARPITTDARPSRPWSSCRRRASNRGIWWIITGGDGGRLCNVSKRCRIQAVNASSIRSRMPRYRFQSGPRRAYPRRRRRRSAFTCAQRGRECELRLV